MGHLWTLKDTNLILTNDRLDKIGTKQLHKTNNKIPSLSSTTTISHLLANVFITVTYIYNRSYGVGLSHPISSHLIS
jgi:hypothetical protein